MSDMAPDGLNAKKFYGFVVCFKLVSLLFQLTDSRKVLVLRGQLYITDCKDEGNTLVTFNLPEKKTAVILKTLVFERA